MRPRLSLSVVASGNELIISFARCTIAKLCMKIAPHFLLGLSFLVSRDNPYSSECMQPRRCADIIVCRGCPGTAMYKPWPCCIVSLANGMRYFASRQPEDVSGREDAKSSINTRTTRYPHSSIVKVTACARFGSSPVGPMTCESSNWNVANFPMLPRYPTQASAHPRLR